MITAISTTAYTAKPTNLGAISFIEMNTTPEFIYSRLINGHTIQCPFGIKHEYTTYKLAKNELFNGTQIVAVDVDDVPFSWKQLLNTITVKPTIAYETFSHGIAGKGNRYRLLYFFNQPILSKELYENIYYHICQLNGIEISDNCGHSPVQMMHGTKTNANSIFTEIIYNIDDFNLNQLQNVKIPTAKIQNKTKNKKNQDFEIVTEEYITILDEQFEDYVKQLVTKNPDAKNKAQKLINKINITINLL